MSEKKPEMGRMQIGLVACAVLVILLAFSNVWTYTSLQNRIGSLVNEENSLQLKLDSLNATYQNYMATHSHNNSEHDSLQSTYYALQSAYDNYVGSHHYANSEYETLKSERDLLEAPKLIEVNLKADDARQRYETPYLHVHGEVCNVGTNPAKNCRLHVVLYQGAVVAKDTYISLGTIDGESWTSVDSNVYYEGSALTNSTITPMWET